MRGRMLGDVCFDSVKKLFRLEDRNCMISQGIDLWDWLSVREASDRILRAVEQGFMPPDSPWAEAQKQTLRNWIDEGMPKLLAGIYEDL